MTATTVTTEAATQALHRAAADTGYRVTGLEGPALRIQAAGTGGTDDVAVTAAVVVDDDGALTASYRAQVDWDGILDGEDFIAAQATINTWNNGHIAPRLIGYRDTDGHVRLRGEVVLNSLTGVTSAQLTEWIRMVVTAAQSLQDYLREQWPDVAMIPLNSPLSSAEPTDGADGADGSPLPDAPADAAAGLIDGELTPVTLERIADALGDPRPEVEHTDDAGNGTVPVAVGDISLDVSFHAPVITVSAGARFGELDADTAGYLLSVCSRWNANPAGIVIVLRNLADTAGDNVKNESTGAYSDAALVAALHLPAPSGLTDDQLEASVTASCRIVADSFRALVDDITGD